MTNSRNFAVFKDCLRKYSLMFLMYIVFLAVNFTICILYRMQSEPFIYASILTLSFLIIFYVIVFAKEVRNAKERLRNVNVAINEGIFDYQPKTLKEKDFYAILTNLNKALKELNSTTVKEKEDMLDYYTTWVHQIKTPIAVLKLKYPRDSEVGASLSPEIFRIEQYVDMALNYVRLNSDTNDLIIREYSLDEIIRETARKFAQQFILKKIKFEYLPVDKTIITDKKWFCSIIEQFFSNAIKYTNSGSISVYIKNNCLYIEDTGIGISKEDLPRIFEKGYTGLNGRLGEKSSGLGLYLCKKAAQKLALPIKCESTLGKGSRFIIDLSEKL